MPYDLLVVTAHPDDAEVQMGGTIAKLTAAGQRALIVDLCDGEPADYAVPGTRREQALRAAKYLGPSGYFWIVKTGLLWMIFQLAWHLLI